MAELEIVLVYSGPDIQDGAMAVEDIVPVLQGFAGAYGKLAASQRIVTQHKLRLVAMRPGSAKLILDIWEMIGKNVPSLQAVSALVGSAMAVLGSIIAIIQLKKHTKNEPYSTKVDGTTGLVNVINADHVALAVSLSDFNIFKDKMIETDLARIVRPLESGHIDESKISVNGSGHVPLDEKITAAERPLFDIAESAITTTKETWITGQINSMTKSTNSGYMYLNDGSRVHFKLKGDNPSLYYGLFGHEGLVRVRCVAHVDDSFRPTELDVYEMIPLQLSLFGAEGDQSNSSLTDQT